MLLKKLDYLPEAFFLGGEEIDLCFRMKRLNKVIFYTPHSKCIHRVGYSSKKDIEYIYNRFRNRLLLIRRNYSLSLKIVTYLVYIGKNILIMIIIFI